MGNKNLKDKAISIKGKQYVLVQDRIIYFNETYPAGMIQTYREVEGNREIIKAVVTPDVENIQRNFTAYSQALWGEGMVNKTAALENAETSAVGRALAMMGIGVIDSVASADEMHKAGVRSSYPQKATHEPGDFTREPIQQDEPIRDTTREYVKKTATNTRWCVTHPTSFWGLNVKTGEYYEHCSQGFKDKQTCVPGGTDDGANF